MDNMEEKIIGKMNKEEDIEINQIMLSWKDKAQDLKDKLRNYINNDTPLDKETVCDILIYMDGLEIQIEQQERVLKKSTEKE